MYLLILLLQSKRNMCQSRLLLGDGENQLSKATHFHVRNTQFKLHKFQFFLPRFRKSPEQERSCSGSVRDAQAYGPQAHRTGRLKSINSVTQISLYAKVSLKFNTLFFCKYREFQMSRQSARSSVVVVHTDCRKGGRPEHVVGAMQGCEGVCK